MAHEKISGDTLFYFQKVTPPDWHDETVGKLTPEDIDSNFYTLKSMDIKDVTFNNGVLSFVKYDCDQSFDVDLNTQNYATREEVSNEINTAVSLLQKWVGDNIESLDKEIREATSGLSEEIASAMTSIDSLRETVISALTAYNTEITTFEDAVEQVVSGLLSEFNDFKFEVRNLIHEIEVSVPRTCYLTIKRDTDEMGTTYGEAVYVRKNMVRVLAEPKEGYMFVGWDDGSIRCEDWQPELANPWYFTILQDTKITALFAKRIPVTVQNDTPEKGIIELQYFNEPVIASDREIVFYAPEGYPVKLKATPFDGYDFIGWSNGETSPEIKISPDEITNIKPKFGER